MVPKPRLQDISGELRCSGMTADGQPVAVGGRYFARAILVDPRRRCEVLRPLERTTRAWLNGEPASLWVVRLGDGREAVVDPSLLVVAPMEVHMRRLGEHWRLHRYGPRDPASEYPSR